MIKCGKFIILLLGFAGCNSGKTGEELYDAGIQKLKAGDKEQAFKLLNKAAKKREKIVNTHGLLRMSHHTRTKHTY